MERLYHPRCSRPEDHPADLFTFCILYRAQSGIRPTQSAQVNPESAKIPDLDQSFWGLKPEGYRQHCCPITLQEGLQNLSSQTES
ncbi:MAG: hypothetical protein EBS79_07260 [Gammaproteobacteria bacterium]|nr:hypothetical protein [Gammaproteobacteria bacterium]NBY23890.1 hypothetical protein [Gammaproteobacteria bacterium]